MSTLLFKTREFLSQWNLETILCTSLVLLILVVFFQYHWKRRHLYKPASKVSGPKGWPLIGVGLDFGDTDAAYDSLTKYFNSYPDLFKLWFGPQLIFGVSKPEYLEAVLKDQKALSKLYLYKFFKEMIGYGLITVPAPECKRHRKIIMPAFNQKILEGFVEVFERQSITLCERLEKHVGKGEFDVINELVNCTLDILCGINPNLEKQTIIFLIVETAMGLSVNDQSGNSTFGSMLNRLFEIVWSRMFIIWYHFDFIFKWTKLSAEFVQLLEKYIKFVEEVVQERRQNPKPVSTRRKAFLDLLLEASSTENTGLTETEVRDEVNTMIAAGSETTANTLAFLLIMLAMHPQIQENLFQEVISVLGPDRTAESQDLPLLRYTERVIKETLRLFPVAAFIGRDINDDLTLGDGVLLPKGSSVLVNFVHLHRNGNIWPNPLNFDPDRFLPEEVAKRHPYAYLPFSGGPRNCVGSKYAVMSIMTITASLVRKLTFHTSYKNVEDIKLKFNVVLRPRQGYKISLELRK